MTLNVAGLLLVVKRKRIAQMLKQSQADVVCLQKTHIKVGEAKYLDQVFQGFIYHTFVLSRSKGVLVGISRKNAWLLKNSIVDKGGRYVVLMGCFELERCLENRSKCTPCSATGLWGWNFTHFRLRQCQIFFCLGTLMLVLTGKWTGRT